MPNTILLKRGTTAKNDVYTGQSGEITVDTDVKNVRVHDGITPGGTALAKATHVHAIADVSNLTVSLAGKADAIHSHSDATTGLSGFLSASDKSKIDGIEANANNYIHPTADGSLHVPATGTGNNLKVLKAGATAGSITWGNVAFAEIASKPTTLAGYGITDAAPLASPALTGTPTAPTATVATNTTQLATTAFVQSAVGQITAGTGLTKTGNSIDVGTASTGRIVINADNIDLATTGIAGGTYRSLTIDAYGRATAGTNPTTLAGYGITDAAPLASPALTGTPTAPTATAGTNTTQLATTAFVMAALAVIDGGIM